MLRELPIDILPTAIRPSGKGIRPVIRLSVAKHSQAIRSAVVLALVDRYGRAMHRSVAKAICARGCGDDAFDEDDVVQESMFRLSRRPIGAWPPDESFGKALCRVVLTLLNGQEPAPEDDKRVRGWLVTIAKRILTDWTRRWKGPHEMVEDNPTDRKRRRRSRALTVDDTTWTLLATCKADHREGNPADIVADREILIKAIESLDHRKKTIVVRRYEDGDSFAEIAGALGLSANRVRTLHREAIVRLRAELAGPEGL